jgi:hypothetical protein
MGFEEDEEEEKLTPPRDDKEEEEEEDVVEGRLQGRRPFVVWVSVVDVGVVFVGVVDQPRRCQLKERVVVRAARNMTVGVFLPLPRLMRLLQRPGSGQYCHTVLISCHTGQNRCRCVRDLFGFCVDSKEKIFREDGRMDGRNAVVGRTDVCKEPNRDGID